MRVFSFLVLLAIREHACAQSTFLSSTSEVDAAAREYQREHFDAALKLLDGFEKSSAPTIESLDLRGCIYLEQQKFDEAKTAFEAAHKLSPEMFAPRIHIGDVFLRQKKFSEARNEYQYLLREIKILRATERLRFAVLLAYLGEQDEASAKKALDVIVFPTQSPSYYYSQAAWAFAHNKKSEANDWLERARGVYPEDATNWFAQHIYHSGWLKKKPPLSQNHD